MATDVTVVTTCCHCKGTLMLETLKKWNKNALKYSIEVVVYWKSRKTLCVGHG